MNNWKKVILLLLVLTPSAFFLSRAFSGNSAVIINNQLEVTGPGGLELELSKISSVHWVETLPELSGTKGFSLGLIKKGNFIRASDNVEIRVIKNTGRGFIHMHTDQGEVYLSLGSLIQTQEIYDQLRAQVPENE